MKVTAVIIFSIIISCKSASPEQKELNRLHDEVMLIHDEVMPKMRDIYQLRRQLKKEEENQELKDLITNLERADDAMMDWMAQYDIPKITEDYEVYLSKQKVLIEVVRNDMLSSIKNAHSYLEK